MSILETSTRLLRFSKRVTLLVGVACFASLSATLVIAESRIWVNAQINGQAVRLVFDTGASHSVLYKHSAQRLGLAIVDPSAGGADPIITGALEACDFSVWGNTFRTRFYTMDLPDYLKPDGDGILGWGMLGNNMFWIDMEFDFMTPLREVPESATHWSKLRLRSDSTILVLEIPEEGRGKSLVLDTGFNKGVALAPERWQQWKATHSGNATTLEAYFMPGAGLVVEEHAWANELRIGSLVLENVPITKANPAQVASTPELVAVLGTTALKQLIIVVDGENGIVYVNVKRRLSQPYEHNRLGAVFVPGDVNSENDYLHAHVADGSPAQLAGIQPSDVLLKINGLDVSQWRSDPEVRSSIRKHSRSPAGTRLHLVLKRDNKEFEVRVTLKDILGPKLESPAEEAADRPAIVDPQLEGTDHP